jgi:hypothetical protein
MKISREHGISELKNSYLVLSALLEDLQGNSTLGSLDHESHALLKFVAMSNALGSEVCISDITGNKDLPGSAVTKLKRAHRLKEEGWLAFDSSSLHHRRIKLTLSPVATTEFMKISATLDLQLQDFMNRFVSLK